METDTDSVKQIAKNPLICIREQCDRCEIRDTYCSPTCEYGILHLLEKNGGFQCCERRTGKTTRLIEIAKELLAAGDFVYYVTPNRNMALGTTCKFGRNDKIKFLSLPECDRLLRGRSGYIVMDEVQPAQMRRVARQFPMIPIVAAYYSE